MKESEFERELENELSGDRGLFIKELVEESTIEDTLILMFKETLKEKI